MEAIRVAPGSNEESCRCVWSYAKALHQGWGYRPGEPLQLGLQVLSLLTELTVAAGKGPKSTLGRRHGSVHTTGPKVLAPGDKGGSSEATQGLTKFGRGRDDQGLHLVEGLGASLDSGVLGALEHTDHLDLAIAGLGSGVGYSGQHRTRRHLRIGGVALTLPIAD